MFVLPLRNNFLITLKWNTKPNGNKAKNRISLEVQTIAKILSFTSFYLKLKFSSSKEFKFFSSNAFWEWHIIQYFILLYSQRNNAMHVGKKFKCNIRPKAFVKLEKYFDFQTIIITIIYIHAEVVPNGLVIGGRDYYVCNTLCSYLRLFK